MAAISPVESPELAVEAPVLPAAVKVRPDVHVKKTSQIPVKIY